MSVIWRKPVLAYAVSVFIDGFGESVVGLRLGIEYFWGCLGVLQHPQAVGEVGNF